MASSYSDAIELVKRNTETTPEDISEMSLDVEYLLDSVVSVAEELEAKVEQLRKELAAERKGLAYCMKKVDLTSSQWSYLEKMLGKK
jgi:hypothetical protein